MLHDPILITIAICLFVEIISYLNNIVNNKKISKNRKQDDSHKLKNMLIVITKTRKIKQHNRTSGWKLYDDLIDEVCGAIEGVDGFTWISEGFNQDKQNDGKFDIHVNIKLMYTPADNNVVNLETLFSKLTYGTTVTIKEI